MKITGLLFLLCTVWSASADLLSCIAGNQCDISSQLSGSVTIDANFLSLIGLNIGAAANTQLLITGSQTVNSLNVAAANAQVLIQGTLTVTSNTATNAFIVANSAAVNVTGSVAVTGSAVINGVLQVGSSTSSSASASVTVSGSLTSSSSSSSSSSSGTIYVYSNAALTVQQYINTTQNIYVAANGQVTTTAGNINAYGQTTVYGAINAGSSTASNTYAYVQSNGNLNLQGGVVTSASVTISGSNSFLVGNGNITGNVYIAAQGQVSVGNSPGTVFIRGDYHQDSTSKYTMEASSDNNYDRLIISGTAYLNGYAVAKPIDGYSPSGKVVYATLTHSARQGSWSSVLGNSLSTVNDYSANYGGSQTNIVHNSAAALSVSAVLVIVAVIATLL